MSILLYIAATLTMITMLAHSWVGEARLIRPLMQIQTGILLAPLARQLLRFAWHLTSLLWVIVIYIFLRDAGNPHGADRTMLLLIGAIHLGVGIADAFITRGKHIGWPLLTAIGVTTLCAVAVGVKM